MPGNQDWKHQEYREVPFIFLCASLWKVKNVQQKLGKLV